MRYRIVINPDNTKWYVEVDTFLWFFWTPVYKQFATYHEAEEWVSETGLDKAYIKCQTLSTTQNEPRKSSMPPGSPKFELALRPEN